MNNNNRPATAASSSGPKITATTVNSPNAVHDALTASCHPVNRNMPQTISIPVRTDPATVRNTPR